jgi:hypothetical protein
MAIKFETPSGTITLGKRETWPPKPKTGTPIKTL